MRTSVQWHTQAGSITAENRDVFAYTDHTNASIYLIADGSSSHTRSGELAAALLDQLVLGFKRLPAAELSPEQLAESLLQMIVDSQRTLREDHPVAACSYLILCLLDDAAFSIHEGDCCLGLMQLSGKVTWINNVHCAPNWQGNLNHAAIAQHSSRHSLTRCFSARRDSNPEVNYWPDPFQHWLLATDGFWACLSAEEQLTFMRAGSLATQPSDDITYVSICTAHN